MEVDDSPEEGIVYRKGVNQFERIRGGIRVVRNGLASGCGNHVDVGCRFAQPWLGRHGEEEEGRGPSASWSPLQSLPLLSPRCPSIWLLKAFAHLSVRMMENGS